MKKSILAVVIMTALGGNLASAEPTNFKVFTDIPKHAQKNTALSEKDMKKSIAEYRHSNYAPRRYKNRHIGFAGPFQRYW